MSLCTNLIGKNTNVHKSASLNKRSIKWKQKQFPLDTAKNRVTKIIFNLVEFIWYRSRAVLYSITCIINRYYAYVIWAYKTYLDLCKSIINKLHFWVSYSLGIDANQHSGYKDFCPYFQNKRSVSHTVARCNSIKAIQFLKGH